MNIKKYEIKKILSSPIVIVLMAIFIAFNCLIISENSYCGKELKVLNKIVDKVGYKIDDEMLSNFSELYNEKLNKVNEISSKKYNKTYKSIGEFLDENQFDMGNKNGKFSKEEKQFIKEAKVIESYYILIDKFQSAYEKIDIRKLAEYSIKSYNLSGKAAETARKQYGKFEHRFNELKNNGEYKNLFFIGETYKMHSFLFKDIFTKIIYEIMIIMVLATAYIINYEFDNKTHLIAYSSKRGRHLIKDKLFAAIAVSLIVTTIIIGITLGVYFIVFDYSSLLNVPISSCFNWEYGEPYMSWWNMSFINYLFFIIVIVYLCELIFTMIAFVISKPVKNSYMVFFIFAIILGIGIMLPSYMPSSSRLIFASTFTPFTLIFNPSLRFMESGPLTTFKYYEVITIGAWSAALVVLSTICIKKFKTQNID